MYFVTVLLYIAAYVSAVYCAAAIMPPVDKPVEMMNQDGCYVPELHRVLPYNKPYSPQDGKSCVQYTCHTDNYTWIFTCGALAVGDGCVIVPGDKFLPYPDCCDQPACNHINKD